jgi:hypothetical protein
MPRKKQHLEGRQVVGDQLHEAVADHEGGGRGEHGGDAAEIGGFAHGAWCARGKVRVKADG